jgi:hypothetical protein
MTTYDTTSSTDTGPGGMTDQAQQAASTAKDEAQNVAGVAKEQAQNVAAEAQQQAADLVGEARRQLEDQSRSQLDRLVGSLKELADDLERMARGEGAGSGMAQTLVTEVSDRARSISSQVQGREPAEVLDQVRGFARRKPGTFLLGALAAGVVAGRFARGAKEAKSSSGGPTSGSTSGSVTTTQTPIPSAADTTGTGTAAADPLAGTGTPTGGTVYPEGSDANSSAWGNPTGSAT